MKTRCFVNGSVWVGNAARSRAEAIAVEGDRILVVGSSTDVLDRAGPGSEVVDLGGRFLCPGFQDAHVHPVQGGLQTLACDLSGAHDRQSAVAHIAEYVAAHPDIEFVLGAGWLYPWFEGGNPSAADLDAVTAGKPAYLIGADGHSGWANTAALAIAGIDASTADPSDGRIERRSDGGPQGTLHEGAMELVERVAPDPTPVQLRAGLLAGQQTLFAAGVTAWQDAWVSEATHEAYLALAGSGELKASVRGAVWWDRERGLEQLDEIIELSLQTAGRYVPKTVKLMLDGVCENYTAALLADYTDATGAPTGNRGLDFIDPGELPGIVTAIDAAGLQCHFHALGDRAVRQALDAVAAARTANGWNELRPHLAHLQVVHPDDVVRFRPLGASANIQPLWACPEPALMDLTLPYLQEEQQAHHYPFASLENSGAVMAMGSDWPVSSPDVMAQAAVAVNRSVEPGGERFLPDQRLGLGTVLAAFTAGSAYVNHLDHETGTLAPGFRADIVILDQDPFSLAWCGDVAVDMTVVGGETVYQRSS